MLKHTVCMREKTTSATICPSATPSTGPVTIPFNEAKFFNQITTVVTNTNDYDKIELDQELKVEGDCNTSTSKANCNLF